MSVRILLAPTLDLARAAWTADPPRLTVEAEYGSTVVEGLWYTAAHHQPEGPFMGDHIGGPARSPCVDDRIPFVGEGDILLSHIDLDSVGGVLRALSQRPWHGDFEQDAQPGVGWWELFDGQVAAVFWELAAFVDVRGPHKVRIFESAGLENARAEDRMGLREDTSSVIAAAAAVDREAVRCLHAYWAWSQTRPRFPRDATTDVTAEIREHAAVLSLLLRPAPVIARESAAAADAAANGPLSGSTGLRQDPWSEREALALEEQVRAVTGQGDVLPIAERARLLAAGDEFAARAEALNGSSFVRAEADGAVLVRRSDQFVNHLYCAPGHRYPAKAVVAHNPKTGAVTVSLADPIPGVSARAIVQALWGPEAGGHDGIAGSPRGQVMTADDLDAAVAATVGAILGEPLPARSQPAPVPVTPPTAEEIEAGEAKEAADSALDASATDGGVR